MVSSNIQEQAVKIVEDFFLSRTDEDLYTFLQEVLGRPLVEKVMEKTEGNQLKTARILAQVHGPKNIYVYNWVLAWHQFCV